MKIVYAPEGADPRSWDYEPGRLLVAEAAFIEKHADGMTIAELDQKARRGSLVAMHAYIVVMLKRTAPQLKWDQVQVTWEEIDIVLTDEETAQRRAELEALGDKRTAGQDAMLEQMIADGVGLPEEAAGAPLDETADPSPSTSKPRASKS